MKKKWNIFWNSNNNFLKVYIVLCKNIVIRSSNWAFQSQGNSSNHCNLKQQACKNLQIWVHTIQRSSLICNRRSSFSRRIPRRIKKRAFSSFCIFSQRILERNWHHRNRTRRQRLPQCQKSSSSLTKKQNTCNRISSSLMCLNFSRRNIQKHHNKQKQNCQSTHIDQQLKQNKIFKPRQYQKPRTMKKYKDQIKNRMDWIFRFCHLKNTCQRTCCNQRKRKTHFFDTKKQKESLRPLEFEGTWTRNLRVKSSLLCLLSYKLSFLKKTSPKKRKQKQKKWNQRIFTTLDFIQIERSQQTKNSTLLNSNNSFQGTQCHQNTSCNSSQGCSLQKRTSNNRNQRQRSKQMKQKMTSKKITIKSSSQTNCSKTITYRFQLDKKRCHWPGRSTRQKETYKTYSLTTNSQKSNGSQQSNTLSLSKPSSSCNSRKKRNLPKTICSQQEKKQSTQPNNCCFSSSFRKGSPCCRRSICEPSQRNVLTNLIVFSTQRSSIPFITPFQMNTLQSLSIPKSNHSFTKPRNSTVSCLCMRMIEGMTSSQNQDNKKNSKKPSIYCCNSSKKRQMQTHQRHTLPRFSRRSQKYKKIHFHLFFEKYEW